MIIKYTSLILHLYKTVNSTKEKVLKNTTLEKTF